MEPSQKSDSGAPFEDYVIPVQIHANTSFPFKRSPQFPYMIFAQMFGKRWDLPNFLMSLLQSLSFQDYAHTGFPKLVVLPNHPRHG